MTFKLTANIALSNDFTLTNFAGTIDGQGHLLTNVNNNLGGTLTNLLYHGTAALTGTDVTKTYALTLPEGVTPTSAGVTFSNKFYASASEPLTTDGYLKADGKIYNNDYIPTADAELTTFTPPEIAACTYDGTAHTLNYTITTAEQLAAINACTDCTSLTFTLDANLAAPENFNLHGGTLDGNGKLLTNVNSNIGTVSNLYYRGTANLSGATKVFTLGAGEHFTITDPTNALTFGGAGLVIGAE